MNIAMNTYSSHTLRNFKRGERKAYEQKVMDTGILQENIYSEIQLRDHHVVVVIDANYPEDHIFLHSHSFYELSYCLSGTAQYLIGENRYQLFPGDLTLIPPGKSHCPLQLDKLSQPFERCLILIHPNFIHTLGTLTDSALIPESACMIRPSEWDSALLEQLFSSAIRENTQKIPGWETSLYGYLLQILSHMYRLNSGNTFIPPENAALLDNIIAYIENHLGDSLSAQTLGHHFGISESSVRQLFRQKMDISFHRYVIKKRLIAAKSKISADIPLEQIAHEIGFADYSAFYRAFKKEYGISPSEYRNFEL